ncbi:hypothetical protein [Microvirga sp. Mcv34]|uniref:hypothetical protein n=1 Tax=Microvirga sp. Mcv34 TaxID=2926016 RepID=UPI0021C7B675|nr:hypothetical protein [Microvirga sp. Mcv34]
MRVPFIVACLFLAAPASALDVADMPTWSAEAHVVRAGTSRDTVLVFERTGPGVWKVKADCQVTDTTTRKWRSHKAVGEARMRDGFVVGQLEGLGRVVVAADRLSIDDARCASGPVVLGTGD